MKTAVFRVDAALHIGSGHVMRCLTLADALKEQNINNIFICRAYQGNLIDFIRQKGFEIHQLPCVSSDFIATEKQSIPHTHWLGVTWQEDAEQTINYLKQKKITIDWLIIDHYALDKHWEEQLRGYVQKIMVIDDLADRAHSCELLLDQNLGREKIDYQLLVPDSCQLLIGPQYALLRPEFLQWRKESLLRRNNHTKIKQLLISLGGVDAQNITSEVLHCLAECNNLPKDSQIKVIMGEKAPHLSQVKVIAQQMPYETEVIVNTNQMAQIMAQSDLAIGAAGSTSWERCCLGLPTIAIALAQNQILIGQTLAEKGIHWFVGGIERADYSVVLKHILFYAVFDAYARISLTQKSSNFCDGNGVKRVIRSLIEPDITIRAANLDDAQLLYSWRNAPQIRERSLNTQTILFSDHMNWFKHSLSLKTRLILIAMHHEVESACIRFDFQEQTAIVSIYLSPEKIGDGIGRFVLKAAHNWLRENYPSIRIVEAVVLANNIASQKMFESLGYQKKQFNYQLKLN
ncbi:UDP-2,4-diacetamido-2,4,6-trideoxy-beta-L-altropyranose hydrolase [Neisseria sp. Ec49-e6-T10]|uniref:UDP-2,4-diacetamido-2,4, 6-trideoxy-beta-L-altropyranose hydrolase n=1 Tax=Neisseria sp. Ec49-e6-T10 TaxID=3140744 RepID=UPI003EBE54F5